MTLAAGGPGIGMQFKAQAEQVRKAEEVGDLSRAEQLARQLVSIGESGPVRMHAKALLNLGAVLRQRGQYAQAEQVLRKGLELTEQDEGRLSSAAVRLLFNLGGTLQAQARYAEAYTVLSEALARQDQFKPHHPDAIQARNLLARNQTLLGRFDQADQLLKDAMTVSTYSSDMEVAQDGRASPFWAQYRRAQTWDALGNLDIKRDRFEAAHDDYARAIELYATITSITHPDAIKARMMQAVSLLLLHDAPTAQLMMRQVVADAQRVLGTNHAETARAQYALARILAQQQQFDEVEPLLRQSVSVLRNSGSLTEFANASQTYALFLVKRNRLVPALALYREALDCIDRIFAQTRGLDDSIREGIAAQYTPFYFETINLLLQLHRVDPGAGYDKESLAVASRTQSRLFAEMLREADVGGLSNDNQFKQLRAAHQKAKAQQADMIRARAEKVSVSEEQLIDDPLIAKRVQAQRDQLNDDLNRAQAALSGLEDQLWQQYPRYMELTQPRPVTVDVLQKKLLKPGETLISYALLPQHLLIYVVERERFKLIEVPTSRRDLASLIAQARKPEENPGESLEQLAQLDPAILHQLYELVFKPVEPMLKPKQRLIIVGDGPLHTLPMEMLVSRWGATEQAAFATARAAGQPLLGEYATLPYLGQQYSFAYLPSLSSLASVRLYRKPAVRYDKDFVSFADPVFDTNGSVSADTRSALASIPRSVGRGGTLTIPRLPETAEEAKEISSIVGGRSELYLRERAQEHTLKTLNLKNTRYLHFATHGLLGGEFVMVSDAINDRVNIAFDPGMYANQQSAQSRQRAQPALLLSLGGDLQGEDGLLTMSEVVSSVDLNAELVVLSACNTAGENTQANTGEGFAGLTRAFMFAGAQSLLVSHWSVESRSTQDLMTELFRQLRGQTDKLKALDGARRKTMGSVIQAGLPVSGAHPYFWAPFVYVGD